MIGESKSWFDQVTEKLRIDGKRCAKELYPTLSFDAFRQYQKTGDRKRYEYLYFKRRKRLTTFGLLFYLYPENKRYLHELENAIWYVCNEFTWCLPAHLDPTLEGQSYQDFKQTGNVQYTVDLFACETAFTLAEMITLFEEQLDSFLVEKAKIEVERRVFIPFQNRTQWWETATHNWAAVCGCSIGAAALYLITDRQEKKAMIQRVLQTMEYYLSGFEEDGACVEGYHYWQYGFGYYIYFADLLKRFNDVDLLTNEKIKAIAMLQQRLFLDGTYVVNYSDAEAIAYPRMGFTHYLHHRFSDVHIPTIDFGTKEIVDHCGRWAPAIRELWWFDPSLKGKDWVDEEYVFAYAGIFLSRIDHTAFSVKAGHNYEPHNHNDIGHFILYAHGTVFFRDLGSGQYHQNYFNDHRYQYICNSAEGHSVPIVNGKYQQAGSQFRGAMKEVDQHEERSRITIDLSAAYADHTLIHCSRTFTWHKTDQKKLMVEDRFDFTECPSSVVESFIADDLPFQEYEDKLVLFGKEGHLHLLFDRERVQPSVHRRSFMNHQGKQDYFLHICFVALILTKHVKLSFDMRFVQE
ncbi:hypothetical protein J416_10791 [Gracilibacillus halophilus YIM-C55.5]|uniref:Heparinase II/III-like C-terminal domain-containing protein n=1 Tax=Gracilibacillus halophilus YIM-C55.5 TaxID=1308866 RepID=N4WTC8_9BACI|nr:heparinase II/III family protein [Gracilibacillus halophilus]ENH96416.1 hypothetical protein J416_10791 [Gracilibacillus halophilus YIM-C55.5]